ncbi:hypothetical protein [Burkholderia sp. FL-7-2-10-S1-D7]|uniref:hypothetical protein n=1 Tax=Burkholderia sp. FL-7-2-10-S1-D7 TaxID=1637866 RepID=UPI000B0AA55C|nr:hypothetical protein [Burkholderia sp. FL-7-2-10-S1-D7]
MFSNGYLSVDNANRLRDEGRAKILQLTPKSQSSLVLFRILLGGVKIDAGGRTAIQSNNFFVIDFPKINGFTINSDILRAFPGLGEQDRFGNFLSYTVAASLDRFFRATGTNKGFFEVLLNEMARSFVASSTGNDLSAFVYVYRALEHMSYALPFFHARHANNYVKAFNDLRNLIASGDAELKFCDKFIGYLFSGDPVFSSHKYRFKFDGGFSTKYEKYLKNVHSRHCTINSSVVEIPFLQSFGFLVDVRNKFFHHLSGSNQSASSREIEDADVFFRPINRVAWSIISLVLGRMIAAEM